MGRSGGSLGGYGASSAMGGGGMGGGPMVIPYGGMTEGFMPGRGGGSLAFRPRGDSSMNSSRALPSFSTMGRGMGNRPSMSSPMGSRPSRKGMGTGVMPPSIGYPFRQPPSLLNPSSGIPGMSM